MLPTPNTSHVPFDRVYEPAEDSFLLLDTLSLESEKAFLQQRFSHPPLVIEVGTGSGVVLAFVAQNATTLFGRHDLLTLGIDISTFACHATNQTVQVAIKEAAAHSPTTSIYLNAVNGDLSSPLRPGSVDVLIFNPPYVPAEFPDFSKHQQYNNYAQKTSFEQDSYLLSLTYAGGVDGMETTNRLLEQLQDVLHPEHGVAYVLLCAQNKPREVAQRIREWGPEWAAEVVGASGKQAGWEKLVILRIWRNGSVSS